eukprot:gene12611-8647_t
MGRCREWLLVLSLSLSLSFESISIDYQQSCCSFIHFSFVYVFVFVFVVVFFWASVFLYVRLSLSHTMQAIGHNCYSSVGDSGGVGVGGTYLSLSIPFISSLKAVVLCEMCSSSACHSFLVLSDHLLVFLFLLLLSPPPPPTMSYVPMYNVWSFGVDSISFNRHTQILFLSHSFNTSYTILHFIVSLLFWFGFIHLFIYLFCVLLLVVVSFKAKEGARMQGPVRDRTLCAAPPPTAKDRQSDASASFSPLPTRVLRQRGAPPRQPHNPMGWEQNQEEEKQGEEGGDGGPLPALAHLSSTPIQFNRSTAKNKPRQTHRRSRSTPSCRTRVVSPRRPHAGQNSWSNAAHTPAWDEKNAPSPLHSVIEFAEMEEMEDTDGAGGRPSLFNVLRRLLLLSEWRRWWSGRHDRRGGEGRGISRVRGRTGSAAPPRGSHRAAPRRCCCGPFSSRLWLTLVVLSFLVVLALCDTLVVVHRRAMVYRFQWSAVAAFQDGGGASAPPQSSPSGDLRGARFQDRRLLGQFQFASCNRHEFPQNYWNVMAEVAMMTRYGYTPSDLDLGLGSAEGCAWEPPMAGEETAAGAPPSPPPTEGAERERVRAGRWALLPLRPPLDAFVWLGDIVYSDKKIRGGPSPPPRPPACGGGAEGHDGATCSMADPSFFNTVPAPLYPLAVVQSMWQTQFNASPYKMFRQTCLPQMKRATAAPLSLSNGAPYASSHAHSRETMLPRVWGVWDDHDLGQNDGGKEFPYKNVTREFLFDFLELPPEDDRRHRARIPDDEGGGGVYTFHAIPVEEVLASDTRGKSAPEDEDETELEELVREALVAAYVNLYCVLLLDVRSARDPANATQSGDMLGAAQWAWVESVLQQHFGSPPPSSPSTGGNGTNEVDPRASCATLFIGGGVQFLLDEKITEHWGSYPRSRNYLLHLLRRYHVQRVVFLTGDIHMAELGGDWSPEAVERYLGYPMIEATSSGLTHSAESTVGAIRLPFIGAVRLMSWVVPTLFSSPRRVGLYVGKNFGTVSLEINVKRTSALTFVGQAKAISGDPSSSYSSYSLLPPPSQRLASLLEEIRHQKQAEPHRVPSLLSRLQQEVSAWINVTLSVFGLDDDVLTDASALHHHQLQQQSSPRSGTHPSVVACESPLHVLLKSRLTFPLEMLTYHGGAHYRMAHVDAHTGYVYTAPTALDKANSAAPSHDSCKIRLDGLFVESEVPAYVCAWPEVLPISTTTTQAPRQEGGWAPYQPPALFTYPLTDPLPLFTRVVVWVQQRYFPEERMLFTLYWISGMHHPPPSLGAGGHPPRGGVLGTDEGATHPGARATEGRAIER